MSGSLELLIRHNKWRRGEIESMSYATGKEIGIAIDEAISALKERDVARAAAVKMAGEIQRCCDVMAKMAKATGFNPDFIDGLKK